MSAQNFHHKALLSYRAERIFLQSTLKGIDRLDPKKWLQLMQGVSQNRRTLKYRLRYGVDWYTAICGNR